MTKFEFYNNNPKGVLTEDCVIRSVSAFLNQPYEKTLNDLLDIYKETGIHIGDKKCFIEYLKRIDKIDVINVSYDERITITELSILISRNNWSRLNGLTEKNSKNLLILLCNNHLTYFKDYVIMDTWNCACEYISQIYIYKD